MSARGWKAAALLVPMLLLGACGTPFSTLPPRDQLLIACDGLATTMRILGRHVADGTLRDPALLRQLRATSLSVEESCAADQDFAAALNRLAASSAVLLAARHGLTEEKEAAAWK